MAHEAIDTSAGFVEMNGNLITDAEYHANHSHYSRSTVHSIYKHGGEGQFFVEQQGGRMFSGSSSTDLGTKFDYAYRQTLVGKRLQDIFLCPPPEVLAADGSRRGKPYTEWKASIGDQQEITQQEKEKFEYMFSNIFSCKRAAELHSETTDTQHTVFWTDEYGHNRKARADGVTPECWYDLKTTSSEWSRLSSACMDYGYAWQSAWYTEAALVAGWQGFRMPFIFVQTVPPYQVRVFDFPDQIVSEARTQIQRTLEQASLRRHTGEYLPVEHGLQVELAFPSYHLERDLYERA